MSNLTPMQKKKLAEKGTGTYMCNKDYYTIGQVFRLGLLLNHEGQPYKDKATVSRVLSKESHVEKTTAFGMSKTYTQKQIDSLNNRW